jgi:hypothetical protein
MDPIPTLFLGLPQAFVHEPFGPGVGNSGKSVTLETLSLTKVLKVCFFSSREFAILGSLEPVKSRIRECAEFGDLDSARKRSHEHAEAWNLNCR